MTKIGTVHVEVKPVANKEAFEQVFEDLSETVDAALCVTSTSLIASAVRLHEALWRSGEWLESAPDDVTFAYGDVQEALKRLGMTFG